MKLKVVRQYERGPETHFASFNDLTDARLFIEVKLAQDAQMKLNVTYRIVEFGEAIEEYNPTRPVHSGQQASTASSQGQQSGQNFRPSPVNTTLRPPGMQQNWRPDDPNSGKKEE